MIVRRERDGPASTVDNQVQDIPEKYRGIYRQAMTGRRALKAIRAKCLDCVCWQEAEARNCSINYCSLWPYRMGRMTSLTDATADPSRKGSKKTPQTAVM